MAAPLGCSCQVATGQAWLQDEQNLFSAAASCVPVCTLFIYLQNFMLPSNLRSMTNTQAGHVLALKYVGKTVKQAVFGFFLYSWQCGGRWCQVVIVSSLAFHYSNHFSLKWQIGFNLTHCDLMCPRKIKQNSRLWDQCRLFNRWSVLCDSGVIRALMSGKILLIDPSR